MIAYFGTTRNGHAVIYIPYHFAGISFNGTHFRYRTDLSFLERLAKSLGNNTNLDYFKEKGWDIEEVEINECYLKAFRNFLYGYPKEKIEEEAAGITEMVVGTARNKRRFDGGYEEDYFEDAEDYNDHWWNRGEKAPWE